MKTLLIALLLLWGCSTEKRCTNALKKAERLGCLTHDSVIVKDTIITSHFDTTILHDSTSLIDTVTINNVQVITKWKTREQHIIQTSDTIIKERTIPKVIYQQTDCPKAKWWNKFWIGFICGIGLMFGILYLVNRKNYVK